LDEISIDDFFEKCHGKNRSQGQAITARLDLLLSGSWQSIFRLSRDTESHHNEHVVLGRRLS